jgi:hypothetical protein
MQQSEVPAGLRTIVSDDDSDPPLVILRREA